MIEWGNSGSGLGNNLMESDFHWLGCFQVQVSTLSSLIVQICHLSWTVPGTGDCHAMLPYCHAIVSATPQPACAVKINNPIRYPTVGTITLKAWSVHLPFNPFMYIVKQTGGTWIPVWTSLKICDSLCVLLYKYIQLHYTFSSEQTLTLEFSNMAICESLDHHTQPTSHHSNQLNGPAPCSCNPCPQFDTSQQHLSPSQWLLEPVLTQVVSAIWASFGLLEWVLPLKWHLHCCMDV